jgi:hypothetical protein
MVNFMWQLSDTSVTIGGLFMGKLTFKLVSRFLLTIIKTPSTTGVGEDVGKKESLYTACRNASWCNHSGKQYGGFLKI